MDSTSSTSCSTSLAPTPSPISIQYPEAPDEFNHDHIMYIKRSRLANKERKGKSHVWKFGEAYVQSSDKKEVYYCYECATVGRKQELFVLNGTGTAAVYLEKKHCI